MSQRGWILLLGAAGAFALYAAIVAGLLARHVP